MSDTSHEGKIYDLPMAGETALILDAHKSVTNSSQPLFFFWTDDIGAEFRFLTELHIPMLDAPQDIGSVMTLTFQDPDHNFLTVCQRN